MVIASVHFDTIAAVESAVDAVWEHMPGGEVSLRPDGESGFVLEIIAEGSVSESEVVGWCKTGPAPVPSPRAAAVKAPEEPGRRTSAGRGRPNAPPPPAGRLRAVSLFGTEPVA